MEIKEFNPKKAKTSTPEHYDAEIKRLRKEHDKIVKGVFEFTDAQGGWLDFTYKFFPGEAIKTIRLYHGETCELPMGIVKHLNNCKKKIRVFNKEILEGIKTATEVRGLPSTFTVQSRIKFVPVDMF